MPGFRRTPAFGTSTSICAVRVAGSSTGASRATRPVKVSPGYASTSTTAGMSITMRRRSFSTRLATSRTKWMSTTDRNDEFGAHERAGVQAPAADEPVDRGEDPRVRQVDPQFLEPRRRLASLGPRQVDLRHRRVVPRLGVVERLLRDQVAPEEVPRALEVALGELEVGFALADRGLRHLERRLGLAHLLADFAVLERGQQLAPADRVAQAHVHRSRGGR